MNTAQLRKLAGEAEQRLDWSEAAKLYTQAADSYPSTPFAGSLYERDINNLRKSSQSCARMAIAIDKQD